MPDFITRTEFASVIAELVAQINAGVATRADLEDLAEQINRAWPPSPVVRSDQPTFVINVEPTPVEVVNLVDLPPRKVETKVERDPRSGLITKTTATETNA